MKKLFGTDGIRGVVGKKITPLLAYRTGIAIASVVKTNTCDRPKIIVATDTRASSDCLSLSLCAGITSAGATAINAGTIPTPAVSLLTTECKADAGIMISASHNPHIYNGIKIFDSHGLKLSDELEKRAEDIISDRESASLTYDGKYYSSDMTDIYVSHLLRSNDVALRGFRIGIDTANGASYKSAPLLFKKLCGEVYFINDTPNGVNINENCGSTDVSSLKRLVKEKGLDLGLAFDGDADRLIAVDENGCEADGDAILSLCAKSLLMQGKLKGGVVGTVMSNLSLKKYCESIGVGYAEAAVGDRNVFLKMSELGYNLGGEQSGHIIFSDFSLAGDGQLSAIKLLEALSLLDIPLSHVHSSIKKYPQITVNIYADDNQKERILSSKTVINEYEKSKAALSENGKLILRASGAEPLIRIMAEAPTNEDAERVANHLKIIIESEKNK